jgi:hypothetical protein
MNTPPLVVSYRVITVILTVVIIALVILTLTGHGPLAGLLRAPSAGGGA